MKRLILIASILAGMLATSGAPVASAVTSCTQIITFFDGLNQTGYNKSLCAEDYPLVRNPPTGGSFEGGWLWNGCSSNCSVDDDFTSYRWSSTATPGYKISLFASYNFNAGAYLILTRPSVGNNFNLPSNFNNITSSFAGCGTTCSDDPQP